MIAPLGDASDKMLSEASGPDSLNSVESAQRQGKMNSRSKRWIGSANSSACPAQSSFFWFSAFFLLAAVRVALWLLPFKALRWIFFRLARAYGPRTEKDQFPSETGVWALEAASRYVPRATCLTQAMAGQLLFGLKGTPASVRIGVAKQGPRNFEAHAWLESEGKILIGGADADQRYACLMAFNPWER